MDNPICLQLSKLYLKVGKMGTKQLSTMLNDAVKVVVIIVITIRSIDDNLRIQQKVCDIKT